jgi:general secretion pathway protein A
MYKVFFGLEREPFVATPDPSFLYMTPGHREALAAISYAVLTRRGFAALVGEAGTGKTTLMSRLIQTVPPAKTTFSVLLNSAATPAEFLESVLLDFGLEDIPEGRARRLQRLNQFLISEHREGRTCVLIIDEAQTLSEAVLEEVRLLSNAELPAEKLLQIVLAGQPELDAVLARPGLRQLQQRLTVRAHVSPLRPAEVVEYLHFRWMKAGGREPVPFSRAAAETIAEISGGIPRMVNILCDNALLGAFSNNERVVTPAAVVEAARSLRYAVTAAPVPHAATGEAPRPVEEEIDPRGGAIPEPLPTLERYAAAATRKSRFFRWSAKLRWSANPSGLA